MSATSKIIRVYLYTNSKFDIKAALAVRNIYKAFGENTVSDRTT